MNQNKKNNREEGMNQNNIFLGIRMVLLFMFFILTLTIIFLAVYLYT